MHRGTELLRVYRTLEFVSVAVIGVENAVGAVLADSTALAVPAVRPRGARAMV